MYRTQALSDAQQRSICGHLITAARHRKSFRQSDVSAQLSLAQSTLSRIEAGILMPSILTWYDLCELFDIPIDSIKHGIIDDEALLPKTSGSHENGYRIPKMYSKDRILGARLLAPLLSYIISTKKAHKLIKKGLGFDVDFLFFSSAQISLPLFFDIIMLLSEKSKVSAIELVDTIFASPSVFPPFGNKSARLKELHQNERLHIFAKSLNFFFRGAIISNFKSDIDRVEMEITFDSTDYPDDQTFPVLCHYIYKFVSSFVNYDEKPFFAAPLTYEKDISSLRIIQSINSKGVL